MTRKDFQVVAEILGRFGGDIDAHREDIDRTLRLTNANYNPSIFWRTVEIWRK